MRGGKRGATGMSYVEPTTGEVYRTSAAPYLAVEGLFNDKNYWVNMQQRQQQQQQKQQAQNVQGGKQQAKGGDSGGGVSSGGGGGGGDSLSFDLLDGGMWEYVFIDPMQEVSEASDVGVRRRAGGGGGGGASVGGSKVWDPLSAC